MPIVPATLPENIRKEGFSNIFREYGEETLPWNWKP